MPCMALYVSDVPVTPAPFVDEPNTPESRLPDVLRSSPNTPALPAVLPALLNFVWPWSALPFVDTPFTASPEPLLSHSRHGVDNAHDIASTSAARAGGMASIAATQAASVPAPMTANPLSLRI